jgi:hypothetical protein
VNVVWVRGCVCVCVCVCVCMGVYASVYVCGSSNERTRVSAWMCVCVCVYVRLCMSVGVQMKERGVSTEPVN